MFPILIVIIGMVLGGVIAFPLFQTSLQVAAGVVELPHHVFDDQTKIRMCL